MDKPQMSREVGIRHVDELTHRIIMHATPDAQTDFEEFGTLTRDIHGAHCLHVDARMNFAEVLTYIGQYGRP